MRRIATAVALVGALAVPGTALANGDVTVVHGVPDLTVDVYVNGALTLEDFAPDTVTDPLSLPAGDYDIAIRPADAAEDSDPAISGAATLADGQNVSIVAHLDADGNPTLSVFANDASAPAAGSARLTVRHTAAAPTVDVLAGGDPIVEGLSNPDEASLEVPAGDYSVAVAAAGTTDPVIGPADVTLEEGNLYAVYAVGSLDDANLKLLTQVVPTGGSAPTAVGAGVAGLAAEDGIPAWGIALAGGAALLALGSGFILVRRRPAREQA